jgi:hypothetical protein
LVYLLVFHAYINKMHGSRSKFRSKKSRLYIYIYIYDVKFLALLGAPYIYYISRLRVNLHSKFLKGWCVEANIVWKIKCLHMALFLHILIMVLLNHVSGNLNFLILSWAWYDSGNEALSEDRVCEYVCWSRDDKNWCMKHEIKYMENKAVLILPAHCMSHMDAVNIEP